MLYLRIEQDMQHFFKNNERTFSFSDLGLLLLDINAG